jgi:citrate synthase
MDVLRTSVSVLAHFDPDANAPPTDHAANVRKAERLVAQMATAVAVRERITDGLPVIAPRDDLDHAANFLNMINGKVPSKAMHDAFDISLVLYTEHELNASTFSARVTVSTLSDIYSGIVAAVGTLKGPLHGGANEEAWKVLERVGSPENAERWIEEALARKERIMGFGHRVYKTGDPRAAILKRYCADLAREVGDDRWERIAEPIERAVTAQKLLPPNVDWPSARLYHYMDLDIDLYTPIFAMARVAGWAAHIIEQLDHNRLMRPRALYIGPPHREVKPISDR